MSKKPAKPVPLPVREGVTVSIRASYARLACTAMAKHDIRYYLNGLMIEPNPAGGAIIIGTDGHRLLAILDPQGVCAEPIVIRPDAITRRFLPKVGARTKVGKDSELARLQLTTYDKRPALLVTDQEGLPRHMQVHDASIENGEFRFPDWRRVLPDFEKLKNGHRSMLNTRYLTAPMDAFNNELQVKMQPYQEEEKDANYAVVAFKFEPTSRGMVDDFSNCLYMVMPFKQESSSLVWISNFADVKKQPAVERKKAEETTAP